MGKMIEIAKSFNDMQDELTTISTAPATPAISTTPVPAVPPQLICDNCLLDLIFGESFQLPLSNSSKWHKLNTREFWDSLKTSSNSDKFLTTLIREAAQITDEICLSPQFAFLSQGIIDNPHFARAVQTRDILAETNTTKLSKLIPTPILFFTSLLTASLNHRAMTEEILKIYPTIVHNTAIRSSIDHVKYFNTGIAMFGERFVRSWNFLLISEYCLYSLMGMYGNREITEFEETVIKQFSLIWPDCEAECCKCSSVIRFIPQLRRMPSETLTYAEYNSKFPGSPMWFNYLLQEAIIDAKWKESPEALATLESLQNPDYRETPFLHSVLNCPVNSAKGAEFTQNSTALSELIALFPHLAHFYALSWLDFIDLVHLQWGSRFDVYG